MNRADRRKAERTCRRNGHKLKPLSSFTTDGREENPLNRVTGRLCVVCRRIFGDEDASV